MPVKLGSLPRRFHGLLPEHTCLDRFLTGSAPPCARIPLGYIFESNIVEILLQLFPQPAFRNSALQCLSEVALAAPPLLSLEHFEVRVLQRGLKLAWRCCGNIVEKLSDVRQSRLWCLAICLSICCAASPAVVAERAGVVVWFALCVRPLLMSGRRISNTAERLCTRSN